MAQRHKAREYALQMAFQWEIGRQNVARIEEGFWRMVRGDKNMRAMANQLFEGTVAASAELEALVGKHAVNWRVERMAVMDRVILKLAAWELRAGKTPPKVVLNEALELAKTFSSGESAAELLEQRERVGRSAREAGENLAALERADLHGIRLHDRVADGDLTVPADRDTAVAANGEDGGGVDLGEGHNYIIAVRCDRAAPTGVIQS